MQQFGRCALHIFGALIFTAMTIYFAGAGLGIHQVPTVQKH